MSKTGIKIAADAFSAMQRAKGELFALGPCPKDGNQDIRLAQMLNNGKDAMKGPFCKILAGKW